MSMRLSEVTEAASAAGPNFRIGARSPKASNRVEGKGGQEDLDEGEEGKGEHKTASTAHPLLTPSSVQESIHLSESHRRSREQDVKECESYKIFIEEIGLRFARRKRRKEELKRRVS